MALREGLGPMWRVRSRTKVLSPSGKYEVDAVLRLEAPDGTHATLLVEARARVLPADVARLAHVKAAAAREWPDRRQMFLVAPYLSPRTREACRAQGVAYADQSGAWWLHSERPAIRWERTGALRNPDPQSRGIASLRGRKTPRVLRALIDREPPFTIKGLAAMTGLASSTVSKVLALLEEEALVTRGSSRSVEKVDWRGLLDRWAMDYRTERDNRALRYLAPRGIAPILEKLKAVGATANDPRQRWAMTGAWSARRHVDLLMGARLLVYVDRPSLFKDIAGLRPARGPESNVVLLVPRDGRVFAESVCDGGLWYAPWSQTAVDLLGGTDREPSAGENLLDWMESNEGLWRSQL